MTWRDPRDTTAILGPSESTSISDPATGETWTLPRPTTSGLCAECRHLTGPGECSRIWSGPHGPAQGDPVVIQSGQMLAVLWIREPEQFGCRLWESKLRSVS